MLDSPTLKYNTQNYRFYCYAGRAVWNCPIELVATVKLFDVMLATSFTFLNSNSLILPPLKSSLPVQVSFYDRLEQTDNI